ncbi:MAG TPA: FAD binding domain-containing protein [Oscillospiraceae bacterium]|nr:FAD binding domain-containing protein [Oscillospiraceae bacterium]HPS34338.1 FAD binding domain-containing protein [Oscillospiraceae bacterium]
MIPFNFIYCRPDTLKEAADIYSSLAAEGKIPLYYGGGSEIISMSRAGAIRPDAVIDIKNIPECRVLSKDDEYLYIGSACTLSQISESNLFPLMRLAGGRIADHTNQCRITLGGNLCGTIIYRETSLPLMLSEAQIIFFGPKGKRVAPFRNVFHGRLERCPDEFVMRVQIPLWALIARHAHQKKSANEKIDYPLVTVAALWKGSKLRTAFSGVCSHPFRSTEIETVLNDHRKPCAVRAEEAAGLLPEPPYSDPEGSGEYRLFVFKNSLKTLLEEWENGSI